ncbi:MAG: hypothetical protein JNK73_02675 [Bacteroidia bacterium]|nr:hypothetical protein [Bacteroidia bacterium]
MKKAAILALLAMTSIMVIPAVSAQCPMCKTALTSNANKSKKRMVGNGINKGILFLLSAPYLLAGTAGLVWYRYQKKRKNA